MSLPRPRRRSRSRFAATPVWLLAAVTVAVSACAPDASNATPIGVELANEYINLERTRVPSGPVSFQVENVSTDLVHEIEIFAGGVEGAVLPVDNAVADTAGLRLLDEVEDVVPGANANLTIDLEPGTYLIICNLPAHYSSGMWTYLTVADS